MPVVDHTLKRTVPELSKNIPSRVRCRSRNDTHTDFMHSETQGNVAMCLALKASSSPYPGLYPVALKRGKGPLVLQC